MPVERAGVLNGSNDSLDRFFSRMNVFVLSELVASNDLNEVLLERAQRCSFDHFGIPSVQELELTLRSLASLAVKYHSAEMRVTGRRLSEST